MLYMFSEAVKSPDHFMPSIIRLNNMESAWIQESQFSRIPLSDILIPQKPTLAMLLEEVTPIAAFFILEVFVTL